MDRHTHRQLHIKEKWIRTVTVDRQTNRQIHINTKVSLGFRESIIHTVLLWIGMATTLPNITFNKLTI